LKISTVFTLLVLAWAPIAVSFGIYKIITDYSDTPDMLLGLSSAFVGGGTILLTTRENGFIHGRLSSWSIRIGILAAMSLLGLVSAILDNIVIIGIFTGFVAGLLFARWLPGKWV
jgi:hypothetical protein